jgi:hypothetical protein
LRIPSPSTSPPQPHPFAPTVICFSINPPPPPLPTSSTAPLRPVKYPAAKVLADPCPSSAQHHPTLPRRVRHHQGFDCELLLLHPTMTIQLFFGRLERSSSARSSCLQPTRCASCCMRLRRPYSLPPLCFLLCLSGLWTLM